MDDSSSPLDAANGFSTPSQEMEQLDVNYRTLVCNDEGLRSLSQKLSSMNVTSVGCCLSLGERLIQKIEEENIHDGILKMYCLLVEWRNGQEQANWGMLADCLSSLNDDSLLEELKQIASRCDIAQVVSAPPIQVQSPDVGVPGWSWNLISEKPNKKLREYLDELQDEFDNVVMSVRASFESNSVPLSDFRLKVSRLCVDQQENIPMFKPSVLESIDTASSDEIFTLLTRLEVWDVLNFRVLHKIVKKFIPNDTNVHKMIATYVPKVEAFKKDTKLKDYIRVRASGTTATVGYKTVMVKIKRNYDTFTLANVSEHEEFLANQFLLNQFIFRLKEAGMGCVQVTWLVPANAVPLLMPVKLAEKGEALKKREIFEIRVDDRYVYTNPDPQNAPRKLFPYHLGEDYEYMYQQSVKEPEKFWSVQARKFLVWDQTFTKVNDCQKEEGIVKWFTGGKLNVSKNCLDRHAAKYPDRTAIIWEKNQQEHEKISYRELLEQTCRVANVLKNQCGVQKGDTVVIYMPAMPLAVASMLACARIGAVHSVVFAMLTPEELKERILFCDAKVLITANEAQIEEKSLPLKEKVDKALENITTVQHVLVAKRTDRCVSMKEGRDVLLKKAMMKESSVCEPVAMDSEDDLFVMYTSGATGKPIGVVHTQAGYLLYAALTHKYVFDYNEGDVFACVAVLGWITGHTYVVYGPLCNGATTVLFESTATYPDEGRYWEMVERLKVNQFYTTPSAIRKLMKAGDEFVNKYDLSSLKTIGSVGEPLSTAGWKWYFKVVGKERCILVDTWWQTETGGIAISPQPGPQDGNLKPGYPMRPFFGVEPVLTNEKGDELKGNGVQGLLCLRNPTPGMCRRIVSPDMSIKADYFSYFKSHPGQGLYFTQDYAYRDVDGHYQIQGRRDDIVRVKGVWLQVPEIESEIAMSDKRIKEATIVPLCDPKKQKEIAKDDSWAEDTAVVVQVKPDIKDEECTEIANNIWFIVFCKAGLRPVPQRVLFTYRSPMTESGKISRTEMRQKILKKGMILFEQNTLVRIFSFEISVR